ncbi:hypothetical protein MUP35_03595, partial [Patescibacteria group bacterium]|nr:hypothetical protein [Patescibacteria group bacterium]
MPDVFIAKEEKTKPAKVISPKLENELELGKAKAWGRELRFLSSVAFEPARLSFEGQDPDEKII